MVEVEVTDHLVDAQACVDRASHGIVEAATLADAIRVGLVDLAAAVRAVAGRAAWLDEERWAVLTERAERLQTAAQEMNTHLAAGQAATTEASTCLLWTDVGVVAGADARLRLCALSVAVIGFGGSLRLALPVGARIRAALAAVEHGYARHVIGGLADSVDVIDRCSHDLAAIAELLDATLRIPDPASNPTVDASGSVHYR